MIDQRQLGRLGIGRAEVRRHHRGDLVRRQPVAERVEGVEGVLGRRHALERRIEVGEQHVVGLDRLEAAGLQAPPVAARRPATARCSARARPSERPCPALRSASRRRCAPRRGRPGRRPPRPGRRGRRSPRRRRAPRRGPSAVARSPGSSATSGVVNQPNWRARNTSYSSSGACSRVATIARQARPVAVTRGRGSVVKGMPRWRKPEVAARGLRGRVAALHVLLGLLGQPDRDEPPLQLRAVAPAQHREGRRRRVRPRASRVGEMRDLHHGPEASKVRVQLSGRP